jgi:hypothetical protein
VRRIDATVRSDGAFVAPLPPIRLGPQRIGIDTQDVTDVPERERPRDVLRSNPLLGFEKQPAPFASASQQVLLKAPDGVSQDRNHQAPLRANSMQPATSDDVVQNIRFEDRHVPSTGNPGNLKPA